MLRLVFFYRVYGARAFTSSAVDTYGGVDFVTLLSLAYGVDGAGVRAGTATYTIRINRVRHIFNLLKNKKFAVSFIILF
jgi:hypothetical protein